MHTQDGIREFPDHHCKQTFVRSLPFIRSSGNAIDVGCRDGEYSRFLQQHFAHVFAFDPRKRALFPFNVDLQKVTHFACALGDRREAIEMFGGTHDPSRSKQHSVECYRLDDFEIEDVAYLKIDVEGFEKKVLMGAEKLIDRDRPLIVIEQNDVTLADERPFAAREWLEEKGYKVVATCPRGWDFIMVSD